MVDFIFFWWLTTRGITAAVVTTGNFVFVDGDNFVFADGDSFEFINI